MTWDHKTCSWRDDEPSPEGHAASTPASLARAVVTDCGWYGPRGGSLRILPAMLREQGAL
jgi:hypothetical protein